MKKGKWKKEQWLIVLLAGLLLFVIAIPVSDEKEEKTEEIYLSDEDMDSYAQSLERRMVGVLRKVNGVGEVEVMITLSSSSEKVVEKEREKQSESIDQDGKNTTTYESKETAIYDGRESPYVKKELSPKIEGVLVVAQGGDEPLVRAEIIEAVQALFGIEVHKIKVMKHR